MESRKSLIASQPNYAPPAPRSAGRRRAGKEKEREKKEDAERECLLQQQLPHVRYIARHIHDHLPSQVPLADLIQAGVIGLLDALQKYDSARQVQFRSYANFRIRGAILDSLRELDWAPRELRRRARQVQETISRLENTLGRSASEPEVAAAMGVRLEKLRSLLMELRGLDLERLHPEKDDQAGPMVPRGANAESSPYENCLYEEIKQSLGRAIAELPEREKQVLSLYYYDEFTMKDVGTVLGIGESRVSQIHSLALVRLRAHLRQWLPLQQVQKLASWGPQPKFRSGEGSRQQ
jgi:RNA polymerase sigma factor FliA